MFFYKEVVVENPFELITTGVEGFEYSGLWPGTVQGGSSWPVTFTGFNSPSYTAGVESFESDGGWL